MVPARLLFWPLLLLSAVPGLAAQACIDVSGEPVIEVRGVLSRQPFAGPPNYGEARTDASEVAYILTLSQPLCIAEGKAAPRRQVKTVQLLPPSAEAAKRFARLEGMSFVVTGPAFAAETGHHHAPLLVRAEKMKPIIYFKSD